MTDERIKQTEALYNALKNCINKLSEENDGLYSEVVLNALLNLDAEMILSFAKKGREAKAVDSYCKKLTIAAAARAAMIEVFSKFNSDDEDTDAENDDTETSENTENNTENDNNGND